jgi:mRNA-degrading endonuclease HigB of HigAB toxin-antitoxin module
LANGLVVNTKEQADAQKFSKHKRYLELRNDLQKAESTTPTSFKNAVSMQNATVLNAKRAIVMVIQLYLMVEVYNNI